MPWSGAKIRPLCRMLGRVLPRALHWELEQEEGQVKAHGDDAVRCRAP